MKKNEIITATHRRSAIKVFDDTKKISNEDFLTLLEVAQYSPSSFGLEPWRIIVVQDNSIRNLIYPFATGAQRQLSSASHFIIFVVRKDVTAQSQYFTYINKEIKKMSNDNFNSFSNTFHLFQNEKFDLTDERKRLDWAGKQAYIALGNMMTVASLLNIDSCPIEGFIPQKIDDVLQSKSLINTKVESVAVMAAFGYRKDDVQSIKNRRSLSEIVKVI